MPYLSSARRPAVAGPEPRATRGGPQMSIALDQQAPSFSLPGVDGRQHTLDEYGDADVLVLIQSCNHCPYVLAWEGRMIGIQRDYADRGVRIVAFNSND